VKQNSEEKLLKDGLDILEHNQKLSESELAIFRKIISINEELENRILEQSKMATMGEMIDFIAHQWTQPIGIISLYTKMIADDFKYGDVNQPYLDNFTHKVDLQIEHLLETLKEFRAFLRPNHDINEFSISETIKNSLVLLQDSLKSAQIIVNISIEKDIKIVGSKIEFEHIFINLINNSKDAFIEKGVKDRKINIQLFKQDEVIYCKVQDNAGGVSENILDRIFDLNFTTKKVGKGTGIGLYMVQRIVHKLNGKIDVENIESGTLFTLKFKKDTV